MFEPINQDIFESLSGSNSPHIVIPALGVFLLCCAVLGSMSKLKNESK
jgi:hypothetical protein